jgi:hypothetical protein
MIIILIKTKTRIPQALKIRGKFVENEWNIREKFAPLIPFRILGKKKAEACKRPPLFLSLD